MIGGAMLLCAVGAMLLLAVWSLKHDDAPDSEPREGLLALRSFGESRRKSAPKRSARTHRQRRPVQNEPARPRRSVQFDPDEMAEIAKEAEATLPAFLKASREEY